jgi:hypothetical protein
MRPRPKEGSLIGVYSLHWSSQDGEKARAVPILALTTFLVVLVTGLMVVLAGHATADDVMVEFQTPTGGDSVAGSVEVIVLANATVQNVTFFYGSVGNWTEIGNGTYQPPSFFQILWETSILPDGSYDLLANASLQGGGYAEDMVSGIVVDNTPPTIRFLGLQTGDRLTGILYVNTTTDLDVASVEILISLGAGQTSLGWSERIGVSNNWSFRWATTSISENDDVTLIASAKDLADNEGTALLLGLEVDNTPPPVSLTSPQDNETLDGRYLLQADCTDTHLVEIQFEWRSKQGTWLEVGFATLNATLGKWTIEWNLYELDEYDDVEVRAVAVDDLGQVGISVAGNLSIRDLPPTPDFLYPAEGAHLFGQVVVEVVSDEDTSDVSLYYMWNGEWTEIGPVEQGTDEVWRYNWTTPPLTIVNSSLKAVAEDASNTAEAILEDIEIDNTPPEPRILKPSESEYHIIDTYTLVAISDRDTVSLTFHYKISHDPDEWGLCGEAEYSPDTDRWFIEWDVSEIRVQDSAICATAVDEVGHVGTYKIENIEVGVEPGDERPAFKSTMPTDISFEEDSEYVLDLKEQVTDNDVDTLRFYVIGENNLLYHIGGQNKTGELFLRFVPLPNAFGVDDITLFVVDPANQWVSIDIDVTVIEVLDPPVFHSIPPNLYVHPDIEYSFNYTPYVSDPDTPVGSLELTVPTSPNFWSNSSNPLGLVFLYSENQIDHTDSITITVTDGVNTASRTILVTVTEDWVPELTKPLPDIYLNEDESSDSVFRLDDYFYDRDQDVLYYSYGNTQVTVDIGDESPHHLGVYLPRDWYGEDSVTIRATDPTGALLESTIRIFVTAVNDPPVFLNVPSLPDLFVHYDESYDFDLLPYVQDVDNDPSELILTTDDAAHASRSPLYPLGLRLTYPEYNEERTIWLTLTIDDTHSKNSTRVRVRISNNFPPLLRNPPPESIVIDENGSYMNAFDLLSAWDRDWAGGDYDWTNLRYEFYSIEGHSEYELRSEVWVDTIADVGNISFTLSDTGWVDFILVDPNWNTFTKSGSVPLQVILRVKDLTGAFTEYRIIVQVLPENDSPDISPIPDIIITEGVLGIKLTQYIRDVDNDFASLTIWVERVVGQAGVTNAQVFGELLYLDYRGTPSHVEQLRLWVTDGEHIVSTDFTVTVKAPVIEEDESPLLLLIIVMAVTGGVALYFSRYIWGRFEPPSVQDVFLVYGDGVIIRHLSKRGTLGMDEDLAIAMLTAIQEFVQQSMRSAQLKSMTAGENNILIERDRKRNFYIAVIHTGMVSDELRRAVNKSTRAIQDRFADVLEHWDGNIAKFDGAEEILNDILIISHAHIPEGVRFEMEGITSIEPGKSFLFQGKDVAKTHRIFKDLVVEHRSGMVISRVHPQRMDPGIAEAGAESVWLSRTPTKRGVSPSNTTVILHEITTYVRANKDTVVCLDGLEYLTVHNPIEEVQKFVNELTDMVQVENFILMVHVDPDALEESTMSKLSRDMVPVSTRA